MEKRGTETHTVPRSWFAPPEAKRVKMFVISKDRLAQNLGAMEVRATPEHGAPGWFSDVGVATRACQGIRAAPRRALEWHGAAGRSIERNRPR